MSVNSGSWRDGSTTFFITEFLTEKLFRNRLTFRVINELIKQKFLGEKFYNFFCYSFQNSRFWALSFKISVEKKDFLIIKHKTFRYELKIMDFRLTFKFGEFLTQFGSKSVNYYVFINWWLFLSQHYTLFKPKYNLLFLKLIRNLKCHCELFLIWRFILS